VYLFSGTTEPALYRRYSVWEGGILTSHRRLAPRLRMSGAVPLLPLFAFMALIPTLIGTAEDDHGSPQDIRNPDGDVTWGLPIT